MKAVLLSVPTLTGRLSLGDVVRHTTLPEVQGIITELNATGRAVRAQVAAVRSFQVDDLEVVTPCPPEVQAILSQSLRGVHNGVLEVVIPHHGNRIYLVDTPEQVIQLLAYTIALGHPAEALTDLEQAITRGLGRSLRFRGAFGIAGPLAYVDTVNPRPAPRFAIGQAVHLFNNQAPATVTGITLVANPAGNPFSTSWYYHYDDSGYCIPEREVHAIPTPLH
jgi:hypothetical protein